MGKSEGPLRVALRRYRTPEFGEESLVYWCLAKEEKPLRLATQGGCKGQAKGKLRLLIALGAPVGGCRRRKVLKRDRPGKDVLQVIAKRQPQAVLECGSPSDFILLGFGAR